MKFYSDVEKVTSVKKKYKDKDDDTEHFDFYWRVQLLVPAGQGRVDANHLMDMLGENCEVEINTVQTKLDLKADK